MEHDARGLPNRLPLESIIYSCFTSGTPSAIVLCACGLTPLEDIPMSDYMRSGFRQSGSVTIAEHLIRINNAFQTGQRDAEQDWTADANRWGYTEPMAVAYHAGYCQPRVGR